MNVNVRSAEMWAAIVDNGNSFSGLTVVDFGSGYGDMCLFALRNGASQVLGIDSNPEMVKLASQKCIDYPDAMFYDGDIESNTDFLNALELVGFQDDANMDVAFCFSVLPYLKRPGDFVYLLSNIFDTVYIECQYIGDGPGNIAADDEEMSLWIMNHGFDSAYAVGRTFIKGRNMFRTIWECW